MSVHLKPPKRHCHFGIEVVPSLKWDQWEPGGEYTQQITLKNVNRKTKKLKYRMSNTNFFTTRYPQPIVLNSGTSISLPITFKPLQKEKYEDAIEFITKEGGFKVPMKAILPEAALTFPEMINFGMCAVKDQLSLSFKICNTSDIQVSFQLTAKEPFTISPTSGTLAARTNCDVTVVFKPEGAFVYEVNAQCSFGSIDSVKIFKSIHFEGIGKYVHVSLKYGSQIAQYIRVNFGEVGVGKRVEKSFQVENLSPVQAPFQILQKSDASLDKVFSCSQYHGIIPPDSSIKIRLSFNPENINMTYVDNLEVLVVGLANKAFVQCTGIAIGPEVSLDIGSINFGVVKVGGTVERSFKLRNNSSIDAVFQFHINALYSVFKMDLTSDIIQAKSTKTIVVKFTPTKAIPYYRRIFCLAQNQDPVTLELFGSCCTQEIQPVLLTRQHLQNNKTYLRNGIARLSPGQITQLIQEDKVRINEQSNLLEVVDETVGESLETNEPKNVLEEFMDMNSEQTQLYPTTPHVSVNTDVIDFGRCNEDSVMQKTVSVRNHTHGKVTCSWINVEKSGFTLLPEECDIEALSSASFTVVFKPKTVSKYYNAELEAFIFFKSMRDHRLVEDNAVIPPWCLTVDVMAHTFPTHKEPFLPMCTWDNTSFVFPAVASLDDSVYRTCLLTNNGDNPIHYSFQPDDTKTFSCKPCAGLLRGKYEMIVFKMTPMEFGTSKRKINCVLNETEKFSQLFDMYVSAEIPEVILSPKDFVYFKPTCIGNTSERTVTIKNTSRVPLKLRWKTSHVDESFLEVAQKECIILSNEIQHHAWRFSPSATSKYLFKVKLLVSTLQSDATTEKPRKSVVRFIGEGVHGDIQCDETDIDIGELNVGYSLKRSICINNHSNCSLYYRLHVDEFVTSVDDGEHLFGRQPVLLVNEKEMLLPSRASSMLSLTVSPKIRADYKCVLYYQLVLKEKKAYEQEGDDVTLEKNYLCTITLRGTFPRLHIGDIRGAGCIEHYSKVFLWQLFHIDFFNTLLQLEPSPAEYKYHITSRHSTRRRMPETTKAVSEFNFGSAVYGSKPCVVYMSIHNASKNDTEWILRYPTDFKLDMEYWAETGELDDDESHEMYVMNSELFTISPKRGKIKGGESQTITLVYHHTSLGIHKLPVLFKIVQGREIKLNFIGTTIEVQANRLHFTSYEHSFDPVAIGSTSPIQCYTLHNGSAQKTRFMFDTSVLDIVQEDNYDHRIIECLTPEGQLQPYQSIDTLWRFSPLEARSYSVGVSLMIEKTEDTVITFHGAGYDPNIMGNTLNPFKQQMSNFPEKQLVQAPDQLLKFSVERISFGHISMFCNYNKLVFLSNVSCGHTISYRWLLKGDSVENIVTITPSSGFLKSGGNVVCKVKFHSNGPPMVHNLDIICEVIDETLMAQFKCDLTMWQERLEEKKHLFTIRDIAERKLTNNRPGSSTSKRLISTDSKTSRSDSDLRKYDTLPPIQPTSRPTERHVIVEERACSQDEVKPLPPTSLKVHIGVHAVTHDVEEYRQLQPEQYLRECIQRNPSVNRDVMKPFTLTASHSEVITVQNILSKLLNDLIRDINFKESIEALKDEPIPYYAMLVPDFNSTNNRIQVEENKAEKFIREDGDEDAGNTEVDCENDMLSQHAKNNTCSQHVEMDGEKDTSSQHVEVEGKSDMFIQYDASSVLLGASDDEIPRSNSIDGFSQQDYNLWETLRERQELKRNDEMQYLLCDILESTMFNIMLESNLGEISLTSHPRLISLPPNTNGRHTP